MAEDIKRVGLEFTAEGVQDFKSALKETAQASKENYQELKLAQSQYDKNTSSTKKLKDQQKYLQKQSETYTKKVKVLSTQLEEMENDENANKEAIAKKRSELVRAQTQLNKYDKSLEEVNRDLETHSTQLAEWGQKLEGAGTALTKGVTAPVVAMAAASTAAWKEVDEAMDTIATKTGASGDELTGLQNVAKGIAETVPTDFQTAADAVGEVHTRFGLTGDDLEDLSTKFVKFAEINDTDVSGAVDSASSVLNAFGQDASGAGNLLDALTHTSQQTGLSVDTLASSLQKNAAAFQEMGLTAEESAGLMGQIEMSGMDTSTAMAGLQKAMANATSKGKTMDQALGDFSKTMSGNGSDTDKLRAAYDLFGKKAGAAFYNAAKNGKLDLEDLSGSMSDFAGTTESTFEATQDPLDQFTLILNNLKLLGADIIDAAAPMIMGFLTTVKNAVVGVKTWWESLSPGAQQLIEKIALIAAAIGPLLIGVGKVIKTGRTVIAGVKSISTAFSLLSTGPIGLIVLAIGAAIAAGVLLYKNWDKVKEFAGQLGDKIKEVWGNIVTWTTNTFGPIIGIIKGALEPIISFVQGIWSTVKGVFSGDISVGEVLTGAWDTITGVAGTIWDTVVGVFTGEISVADILTSAWDTLSETAQTVWDTAKAVFETIGPKAKAVATSAWNTLSSKATEIWDAAKKVFSRSGPKAKAVATAAWNKLSEKAVEIWSKAKKIFSGTAPRAKAIATGAWNKLSEKATEIWSKAKSIFSETAPKAKAVVTTAWNTLSETASGVWDSVKEVFTSFDIEWPNFGELASSAFEGLKTAASDAWNWIKGLFGGGEATEEELKTGDVDTSSVEDAKTSVEGATTSMVDAFTNAELVIGDVDTSSITTANLFVNNSVLSYTRMFNNLSLAFPTIGTQTLTTAKAAVVSAVNYMKRVMSFTWNLPTLHGHLPSIAVDMRSARSSDGRTTVSYPDLRIAGYKYFAEGAILKSPTVFGMVGGEKGDEAITPISDLWKQMDKRYPVSGGITNNFYIYEADDANEVAQTVARTIKRELRMA